MLLLSVHMDAIYAHVCVIYLYAFQLVRYTLLSIHDCVQVYGSCSDFIDLKWGLCTDGGGVFTCARINPVYFCMFISVCPISDPSIHLNTVTRQRECPGTESRWKSERREDKCKARAV